MFNTGRNLGIDNLNIGFSESGFVDYQKSLHSELIVETKNVLKDVSNIETAINNNWQGKSRDRFLEQFSDTIEIIMNDLELEFVDLENRFDEIADNYRRQDDELMNS